MIGNREVTNPLVKFLIGISAGVLVAVVLVLVAGLVLAILGFAATLVLAILAGVGILLALLLPVIIIAAVLRSRRRDREE
jgi:hypothetical protein